LSPGLGSLSLGPVHFVRSVRRGFEEKEEEDYDNQQEKKSRIHFLLHNIINR
jgi:hypothetical protein